MIPVRALVLECIGDDTIQALRHLPPELRQDDKLPSGPWVALIRGRPGRIRRDYVRGQKDYSRANSVGSRGVTLTFWLEEGRVYQVFRRLSWSRTSLTYCRLERGAFISMTEDEVNAWLSDPSERMYSLRPASE